MSFKSIFAIVFLVFLSSCAMGPKLAMPEQLVAPEPIIGNSGEYMSPYTEDGVLADWVDMAIKAKAGSQIGAAVGAYAGQKALEQIPFIGGILGQKVGGALGREIALKSAGGMEHIKETSDISFNSLDNMAVYMYVKESKTTHYQEALDATFQIYPEFKAQYFTALAKASSNARKPAASQNVQ